MLEYIIQIFQNELYKLRCKPHKAFRQQKKNITFTKIFIKYCLKISVPFLELATTGKDRFE